MDINRILEEERDLVRSQIEDEVRLRFKHILNGDGPLIPRIAVKIALDDIFPPNPTLDLTPGSPAGPADSE